MIKEKDILPGRVIGYSYLRSYEHGTEQAMAMVLWMIIAVHPIIKRRHARANAPREGWNVLMLRLGEGYGRDVLSNVTISEISTTHWRRMI